ncbi:MAG: hypothetical protein R2838_08330 [Caldilineaceae bacterium]
MLASMRGVGSPPPKPAADAERGDRQQQQCDDDVDQRPGDGNGQLLDGRSGMRSRLATPPMGSRMLGTSLM